MLTVPQRDKIIDKIVTKLNKCADNYSQSGDCRGCRKLEKCVGTFDRFTEYGNRSRILKLEMLNE